MPPESTTGNSRTPLIGVYRRALVSIALHSEIVTVSSDYVKFEIEKIHDSLKRKDVRGFERVLSSVNVASSTELIALAKEFSSKCSLNSLHALHLSATCFGNAGFFLTCDDDILNEKIRITRLSVEKGV